MYDIDVVWKRIWQILFKFTLDDWLCVLVRIQQKIILPVGFSFPAIYLFKDQKIHFECDTKLHY